MREPQPQLFRTKPSDYGKRVPRTNVYYLTIVAYFDKPVRDGWQLVQKVTRHASKLTGELDGKALVSGEDSGLSGSCRTRATCPELSASLQTSLKAADEELRCAMFEAGEFVPANGRQSLWRPSLNVTWSHVALSARRDGSWLPKLRSLTCIIRDRFVFAHDPNQLTCWCKGLWECVAECDECVYGITEFASSDVGGSCCVFDRGGEGACAWEKRLTAARFLHAENRLTKLRGVYWGTYLGAKMAVRLDPEGTFLERFNSLPEAGIVSPPIGVKTGDGGYWLQLNYDVLGGEPAFFIDEHLGIENALWLERELRMKDLLW